MRYLILALLLIGCGKSGRNNQIPKTSDINTAIIAGDYQFIMKLDKKTLVQASKDDKTNSLMDLFLSFDGIESQNEEKGRLGAIEAIIKNQEIDINFISPDDQSTCLSIAVLNNDINGVKILLKYNVNTNLTYGPYKRSALMLSVARKYNEISKLLEPKTELKLLDTEGLDHLTLAKKVENTEYLNYLKEKSNLGSTQPVDSEHSQN